MSLPTPRTLYQRTRGDVSGSTALGVYASVFEKDGKHFISVQTSEATAFKAANEGCEEVTNLYVHQLCYENCLKLSGLEGDARDAKATELGINTDYAADADALADDRNEFEGLVADPGSE